MPRRRPATSPFRERQALRDIQRAEPTRAPWAGEPMGVHQVPTGVDLLGLDGVGLAVSDLEAMAAFLCGHLGMHELDRAPGRLLVGAGDGAATLTIVAAQRPREAGALRRLVLRVADVERAVGGLPAGTAVEGDQLELATFEGPEGLRLGFTLVAGGGIDYDVDHVRLRVSDPEQTRVALAEAGFVPRAAALHVADKYIALARSPASTERPLLDRIAVRVASAEAVAEQARERGLAIDDRAPDGTVGIVLPGDEQIRIHFVERTPHTDAP
ncbi:MAG: VOC family protein [Thermoleophilia bacterium]